MILHGYGSKFSTTPEVGGLRSYKPIQLPNLRLERRGHVRTAPPVSLERGPARPRDFERLGMVTHGRFTKTNRILNERDLIFNHCAKHLRYP